MRGKTFVTCLCLTKDRRLWLPAAISCFLDQRMERAELLIIADGAEVRDLIPADDRIRLIHLEDSVRIGDKRNYGCERAAGNIIAHWDDDDYSGPGRLADQLERLEGSVKAVTGYHSMRFTDGQTWWQYSGTLNYSLGTSLVYRRDWWEQHRFRSVDVGEDNHFVNDAWNAGQLATADAGDLMHATVHPGNTSPRNMGSWKVINQ